MTRRWWILTLVLACAVPNVWADDPPITITRDVVYGHKDGMALTFDVLQPAKPNGAGILFIPTGGWYSVWREPETWFARTRPLTDKGFTVFVVYHGSAPKYTVPETVADVRRAVQFIRMKAKQWDVDPDRLGATGGSAGGHLSLMLAITDDPGDENASDPVLKTPCRIAAAVALFPPTDLRGWPTDPPEAIKAVPALKPPLNFAPDLAADVSPLLHVSPKTAPTLLIHGDKDLLVPIEHSRNIIKVLKDKQVMSELLEIKGAAHGFNAQQNKFVVPAMVTWFVKHLVPNDDE